MSCSVSEIDVYSVSDDDVSIATNSGSSVSAASTDLARQQLVQHQGFRFNSHNEKITISRKFVTSTPNIPTELIIQAFPLGFHLVLNETNYWDCVVILGDGSRAVNNSECLSLMGWIGATYYPEEDQEIAFRTHSFPEDDLSDESIMDLM